MAQKCNFFLQITTIFHKPQLFSTNRNYFLQTTTFFYKSQLYSTILQLFSIIQNFFLQVKTFFYKPQLFSTNCTIFYNLATFFYNSQLFSTYKSQLFSTKSQLFSTEGISESLVWIKEKSVISLVHHMCRVDGKWIASAESRSVRGASHQPIFMGDCPTISHMYLPCLPGEWVSFCVPGAISLSVDTAWT